MRKYMLRCVLDVMSKKKLLVQLKYGQNKETSHGSLVFLCLKEEVEMDDPK